MPEPAANKLCLEIFGFEESHCLQSSSPLMDDAILRKSAPVNWLWQHLSIYPYCFTFQFWWMFYWGKTYRTAPHVRESPERSEHQEHRETKPEQVADLLLDSKEVGALHRQSVQLRKLEGRWAVRLRFSTLKLDGWSFNYILSVHSCARFVRVGALILASPLDTLLQCQFGKDETPAWCVFRSVWEFSKVGVPESHWFPHKMITRGGLPVAWYCYGNPCSSEPLDRIDYTVCSALLSSECVDFVALCLILCAADINLWSTTAK